MHNKSDRDKQHTTHIVIRNYDRREKVYNMSDDNHSEVLSEFTAVTGASEDRAKFYLESANWNLQVRQMPKCYGENNFLSKEKW